MYLIWSTERNMWWNPNERGYTRVAEIAGRYSYEAAMAICTNGNQAYSGRGVPEELMIEEGTLCANPFLAGKDDGMMDALLANGWVRDVTVGAEWWQGPSVDGFYNFEEALEIQRKLDERA